MNRIEIDESYCKGCALCTQVCPHGLLEMSTQLNAQGFMPAFIPKAKMVNCTACALCARICPDAAISVFREIPPKAAISNG